jgi:ABC-2 type transport system permease protein
MTGIIRGEVLKITSTRLPLAFVLVLLALVVTNMIAVVWGEDYDGTKGFIATAGDQRSLVAFAANAVILSGLFGAVAASREYTHQTVIPMFLLTPRRGRAYTVQVAVVGLFGALLGALGAGLLIAGVAAALAFTDFGFLMSAGGVARVIGASALAGFAGAVLGVGVGAVVRNTGGAVSGVVVILLILPPTLGQLAQSAGSWVPATLSSVLSGTAEDVSVQAAVAAILVWALLPAVVGAVSVLRRDVA